MNRCPQCGGLLVLAEIGSYGGARLIQGDGSIVPDSYHEEWSECDEVFLRCVGVQAIYKPCGFEYRAIDVRDEKVVMHEA
jgi:hypothetical protein